MKAERVAGIRLQETGASGWRSGGTRVARAKHGDGGRTIHRILAEKSHNRHVYRGAGGEYHYYEREPSRRVRPPFGDEPGLTGNRDSRRGGLPGQAARKGGTSIDPIGTSVPCRHAGR